MKEELIEEMERNLSLVMDYNEYQEDCGYGDQNYINFEYNKMATELIGMGWTKPVWHKVADRDFPPANKKVLFKLSQYNELTVGFLREDGLFDLETYPSFYSTDADVIAWAELPKYEE